MKFNLYEVTLTNGMVNYKYKEYATCEQAAIILAQAEAITSGKGYELVEVKEVG